MIVIPMQIAAIPTVVLHARAILDTRAMERFVKVFTENELQGNSVTILKPYKIDTIVKTNIVNSKF